MLHAINAHGLRLLAGVALILVRLDALGALGMIRPNPLSSHRTGVVRTLRLHRHALGVHRTDTFGALSAHALNTRSTLRRSLRPLDMLRSSLLNPLGAFGLATAAMPAGAGGCRGCDRHHGNARG
ncbi:MAG: hypothetical protein ABIW33_02255 [Sphingomicrobium sp.]